MTMEDIEKKIARVAKLSTNMMIIITVFITFCSSFIYFFEVSTQSGVLLDLGLSLKYIKIEFGGFEKIVQQGMYGFFGLSVIYVVTIGIYKFVEFLQKHNKHSCQIICFLIFGVYSILIGTGAINRWVLIIYIFAMSMLIFILKMFDKDTENHEYKGFYATCVYVLILNIIVFVIGLIILSFYEFPIFIENAIIILELSMQLTIYLAYCYFIILIMKFMIKVTTKFPLSSNQENKKNTLKIDDEYKKEQVGLWLLLMFACIFGIFFLRGIYSNNQDSSIREYIVIDEVNDKYFEQFIANHIDLKDENWVKLILSNSPKSYTAVYAIYENETKRPTFKIDRTAILEKNHGNEAVMSGKGSIQTLD